MKTDWAIKVLGWTLFMLMIQITTWSNASQLFYGASTSPQAFHLFQLTRMTVFSLAFFASALISFCSYDKVKPAANAWCSALTLLLGVTLLVLSNTVLLEDFLLVCIAALFLGMGSASFFVLWQRVFAAGNVLTVGLQICVASIAATGLYFLATKLWTPYPLFIALVFSVVLGLFLLLEALKANPLPQTMLAPAPKSQKSLYKTATLKLWKPILCVSSLSFVWQLTGAITVANSALENVMPLFLGLGSTFGSILLFFVWRLFGAKINLTMIYQIIFPLVATGFLLLPFLGGNYSYWFAALTTLAFCIVSIMMQLTCIMTAQDHSIRPVYILGLFAGCVYGFMGAGYFLGAYLTQSGNFGFVQLLVLALVSVYILSLILIASREKQERIQAEASSDVVAAPAIDLLAERCAHIAKNAHLSNRESEILQLIVRGRDVPHIAKMLYITENTVRTHNKRIYRKIGIHTKQDLLSLLEEVSITGDAGGIN